MPYKIAIASGKGGTGKTTVSVNLLNYLQNSDEGQVCLVDCDVEEPNDLLFFPKANMVSSEVVKQLVPEINIDKCTFCGRCADYCEFNAIRIIPSRHYAKVDSGLCHSCGACVVACQDDAIIECEEKIGQFTSYATVDGAYLAEGRLKVGSPMQTMLIKEVKKRISHDNAIILYDAPPGTSCSVVETISDVDFVVLVSEPTLFGLHDLKLMVELTVNLNVPFGLVINKAGLGDEAIYQYIKEEKINLLGEIPFSKAYASQYAKGNIIAQVPLEITEAYDNIIKNMGFGIGVCN